jgi:hypothetical protein
MPEHHEQHPIPTESRPAPYAEDPILPMPIPFIQRPEHPSISEFSAERSRAKHPGFVTEIRQLGGFLIKNILYRNGAVEAATISEQLADSQLVVSDIPIRRAGQFLADTEDATFVDLLHGARNRTEYQQSHQAKQAFDWSMQQLPRVHSALTAYGELVIAQAADDQIQESHMFQKFTSSLTNPHLTRIAAVLDAAHLPLAQKIGTPIDRYASAKIVGQAITMADPATAAVLAERGASKPAPYIKRSVLSSYVDATFTPQEAASMGYRSIAERLPATKIKSSLVSIDAAILRARAVADRHELVRATIKRLFDKYAAYYL